MRTVLVVEDDFDTLHPLAELLRLKATQSVQPPKPNKA